eukprot:635899-Rhodomonas_salina.1
MDGRVRKRAERGGRGTAVTREGGGERGGQEEKRERGLWKGALRRKEGQRASSGFEKGLCKEAHEKPLRKGSLERGLKRGTGKGAGAGTRERKKSSAAPVGPLSSSTSRQPPSHLRTCMRMGRCGRVRWLTVMEASADGVE